MKIKETNSDYEMEKRKFANIHFKKMFLRQNYYSLRLFLIKTNYLENVYNIKLLYSCIFQKKSKV